MKKIISILSLMILSIFGFAYAEEVDTDKTIKVNKYITDSFDSTSEVDYFDFELSKQGSVQIEIEFAVEGKYYIRLYDVDNDNKEILYEYFATNYNTPTGKETQFTNKVRLKAGEYRIRVSIDSSLFTDDNYKIKVNYDKESKGDYEVEANNDAKSAMEIETNEMIIGNLQSSRDVDFYMVELPYAGSFRINFEYFYEGEYNVQLYGINGSSLKELQYNRASTQIKPYGSDYFNQSFDKLRLPAGVYYIKISNNKFANDDYKLIAYYNIERYGNFEEEFNDNAQSAVEIYNNVAYIGNLTSNKDVDYYSGYVNKGELKLEFEIPQDSKYLVNISKETVNGSLTSVANYEINNEDKTIVVDGVEESSRYYFKVSSKNYSNNDYTIKFLNNIYVPVYQGTTKIDLQIGNKYMNVNGVGRLIDNNGTMPVLSSGRTMLPIRAVIEALGGTIEWDNDTFTTTIKIDNKNIKIKVGDKVAYVNGTAKSLDVPAQLINQRTMLPLRFVMENLGGTVTWDDNTQIVVITK